MAIEYLNNYNDAGATQDVNVAKSWLDELLALYDWNENSSVDLQSDGITIIGKYYFTANSYLQIYTTRYGQNSFWILKWEVHLPSGIFKPSSDADITYYNGAWGMDIKATKTSKGIGICLYNYGDDKGSEYHISNAKAFNFFIGEYVLNGVTKKGLIYMPNKGTTSITNPLSCSIWSDDEYGTSVSFYTYVDADRKAIYIPLVSPVTGAIFNDIYIARYTPLNFNILDLGNDKLYVCAKGLCIGHSEGA